MNENSVTNQESGTDTNQDPREPISPRKLSTHLLQRFAIKRTAVSHVVSTSGGDELYVVLLQVHKNENGKAVSGRAELSTAVKTDDFDRGMSGHLTELLKHAIAFDGCPDPSKPHCAGSSSGYRPRKSKREVRVPEGHGHAVVREATKVEVAPFASSEVPASKIEPIFRAMNDIGEFGIGE